MSECESSRREDHGDPRIPDLGAHSPPCRVVATVVARAPHDRRYLGSLLPQGVVVHENADPRSVLPLLSGEGSDLVLVARAEGMEAAAQAAALRAETAFARTEGPLVVVEASGESSIPALLALVPDDIVLATEPEALVRRRIAGLCRRAEERSRCRLLAAAANVSSLPTFVADAAVAGFPVVMANAAFRALMGSALMGSGDGASLGLGGELLIGSRTEVSAADAVRASLWKGEECAATIWLPHEAHNSPYRLSLWPVKARSRGLTHWIGTLAEVPRQGAGTAASPREAELEALLAKRTREVAEAQHRLDTRRQFIETVLDSLSAGVIAADAEGVVVLANRSALALLELESEDCLGVPVRRIFGDGAIEKAMADAREGERRVEFPYVTPSGRRLEIGLSVTVVGGAPRLGGISGEFRVLDGALGPLEVSPRTRYVFVFRDLGVQRQFEIEMRRVEGLSALGQMATAIAHEIRNPLAAMRSLIELLLVDLSAQDEKREYATRVLSLLSRIEKIVKNSLRFARPKLPVILECRPGDLIEDALEILEPRLGGAGRPVVTLGAGLPDILADPDQIVEVFVALLENALDAAKAPSGVEVRAGLPEAAGPAGPFVQIDFLDDGPGIRPDIARNVFDPFFTTKARGTGLGLSIAQRLVQENRGHLHLLSREAPGTCVRLLLPASRAEGK